jgi:glycolate dehydrogenase iron-sulfur subunit
MRAVAEGKLARESRSFESHIDRCLGCRACEPVCPAGVEYGQLLEVARAELFQSDDKRSLSYSFLGLMLRHVWLHPTRLRFVFTLARLVRNLGWARLLLRTRVARLFSRRLEFGIALLVASSPEKLGEANELPKQGTAGWRSTEAEALLFTGCVTAGLFERVNQATERVLGVNGFRVEKPSGQVCCGALHAHAGDLEGARELARQNIEAFSNSDNAPIVTNAGGCGAMMVSYAHLLEHDPSFGKRARDFASRVQDISQQLEKVEIKKGESIGKRKITYDASCHLLHGQHADEAPLKMLRSIPDLELVPLRGSERCCGGAGVYNLLEPDMSSGVLGEKLDHIRGTRAEILATGNAGCHMQIAAGAHGEGMDLLVCHPVELLDESYRRAGLYLRSGHQYQ